MEYGISLGLFEGNPWPYLKTICFYSWF